MSVNTVYPALSGRERQIFNQLGDRRRPGRSIEVAVSDMLVLVNEGESQVVV